MPKTAEKLAIRDQIYPVSARIPVKWAVQTVIEDHRMQPTGVYQAVELHEIGMPVIYEDGNIDRIQASHRIDSYFARCCRHSCNNC
jgi:hypothetical protein